MYYPLWWQPLGVSTRGCTFRRGCLPGGKGCTFQEGCYFQGLYLASPRRDLGPSIPPKGSGTRHIYLLGRDLGPGIPTHPILWTEWLTDTYENITFLQLYLWTIIKKLRTLQKIQLDTNTYEQFRGIPCRENLFLVVIAIDNKSDQPAWGSPIRSIFSRIKRSNHD